MNISPTKIVGKNQNTFLCSKTFSSENRVFMRKCLNTVKPERPPNGNLTQRRKHAIRMLDDYGKNTDSTRNV
jgi:hypothetical protein